MNRTEFIALLLYFVYVEIDNSFSDTKVFIHPSCTGTLEILTNGKLKNIGEEMCIGKD